MSADITRAVLGVDGQRKPRQCRAGIFVGEYELRCQFNEGHWGRHRDQIGALDDISWEVVNDVPVIANPNA